MYGDPQGGAGGYAQGYTAPPGAYPPQNSEIAPEVQQWFNMVDRDRSGKINCTELQAALANGKGQSFSETACKLMISEYFRESIWNL